jgi:hypothetical protein
MTSEVETRMVFLQAQGIKTLDSLHLALAEINQYAQPVWRLCEGTP